MPSLSVIFDTDPGVDDAMALLLLARHPAVEIAGITTVFGNGDIDTVTRNALYLKERFGISAPVARGADRAIAGAEQGAPAHFVHGRNGLGDIALPETIAGEAIPVPAPRFIIDTVRARPGEITLIAVGRMTNLALALREDPEIVRLVREVVVMGGAFGRNGHFGNVSPVAEANIYGDPHAADAVFTADWPVTIAGLDVTQETVMTDAFVEDLARTGEDGVFVRAISAFYQQFHRDSIGLDGFFVHDSTAVGYALHPELFTLARGAVRVVVDGIARGQTILKPEDGRRFRPGPWDGVPAQAVCIGVDAPALLALCRQVIAG
jgi:inosine-uridine nucleoside N-ribohydrolase